MAGGKGLLRIACSGPNEDLATHQAMQCVQKAAMTVTIEGGRAEETIQLENKVSDVVAEDQAPGAIAKDVAPSKGLPQPQAEPGCKSRAAPKLASQNPYAPYYRAIGGVKVVLFVLVTLAVSTALEYTRSDGCNTG
ncbi:hypothetical protein ISF_04692 [Cordyceps fumosorosea ARSEF 2679]|uniref:Uncharacterized protein n=1 Tax=Cordyceps fumosorosea (strain ARSEF 2679) TaxID=1081104 RepID=A0A167WMN6_CORFA|nr:hypothetical protein ISF_04692 [Cordyceps fumosorosea ARSEF 2679]OAA63983.1 hypothetical protein ISF_04692 [Cordyceps fumosorosea ARSEF 2679]